jgi:thiamine pyrophosphate-dependent acetolactate synthase large subunit-like protein
MSPTGALTIPEATRAIARAREAAADAGRDPVVVVTMSALPYWPTLDSDYRLVSLMGSAGAIGLGLAIGAPARPVWVVDGDGSLLMQLGVLPAIARCAPAGFVHIVMANGVYAISGEQPTPGPASWRQLFTAAGFGDAAECASSREISAALATANDRPRGVVVRCSSERPDFPAGAFQIVDPAGEVRRVRAALAG